MQKESLRKKRKECGYIEKRRRKKNREIEENRSFLMFLFKTAPETETTKFIFGLGFQKEKKDRKEKRSQFEEEVTRAADRSNVICLFDGRSVCCRSQKRKYTKLCFLFFSAKFALWK